MTKAVTFLYFLFYTTIIFGQHNFHVDFSKTVGNVKVLTNVNKANPRYLQNGYKDAGISYVRLHDYHGANDYCYYSKFWNFDSVSQKYTTINENFDPNNPACYSWKEYDKVIYGLFKNNVKPYVRFGCSYPGPNYPLQPMAPPLDSNGVDFTNFAKLCKQTIMHTNFGWNNGTHFNVEYWEIWNEPQKLFWDGTPAQFYKMFKTVMDTLKLSFPTLKIGGPGAHPSTTLGVATQYGADFLSYLKNENTPLDFYSWHIYGLKNPFLLAGIAKKVRTRLDTAGFTNTESHISEINHALNEDAFDYFDSNSKGTAYYASLLITAQNSSVDKMFWYPGDVFFEKDGKTYTWTGYALKYYNMILQNTPAEISSSGDVVVTEDINTDTTNIMLLAAKSDDGNKLYILLSNYNSDENNFKIRIDNLPWQPNDSVSCIQHITKNPNSKDVQITTNISFTDSLIINLPDLASPSVALLEINRIPSSTGVNQNILTPKNFELTQNYPNPFNPNTIISYSIASTIPNGNVKVELNVYNALGKKVKTLVNKIQSTGYYNVNFNGKDLASGVYYCRLNAGGYSKTIKMLLLK